MSKQFWLFLLAGLAAVGIGIGLTLFATKGNHLELTGSVVKTVTLPGDTTNSTIVLQYRVTNPSDVPFVVERVDVIVELDNADPVTGSTASETDAQRLLKFYPQLRGIPLQTLKLRDVVAPHQTLERSVAASIPVGEPTLRSRKGVLLRFVDVDGATSEMR